MPESAKPLLPPDLELGNNTTARTLHLDEENASRQDDQPIGDTAHAFRLQLHSEPTMKLHLLVEVLFDRRFQNHPPIVQKQNKKGNTKKVFDKLPARCVLCADRLRRNLELKENTPMGRVIPKLTRKSNMAKLSAKARNDAIASLATLFSLRPIPYEKVYGPGAVRAKARLAAEKKARGPGVEAEVWTRQRDRAYVRRVEKDLRSERKADAMPNRAFPKRGHLGRRIKLPAGGAAAVQ